MAMSWQERAFQSVVKIHLYEKGTKKYLGSGTGFFVHSCGLIVTCAHVLRADNDVADIHIVQLHQPRFQCTATILRKTTESDIGLLLPDIVQRDVVPLTFGSQNIEIGDDICMIGCPGSEYSIGATHGRLSSKNAVVSIDRKQCNRFRTDSAGNPGQSGGPVFNREQVIGMFSDQTMYEFAQPSGRIIRAHEQNGSLFLPVDKIREFIGEHFNVLPEAAKEDFRHLNAMYIEMVEKKNRDKALGNVLSPSRSCSSR